MEIFRIQSRSLRNKQLLPFTNQQIDPMIEYDDKLSLAAYPFPEISKVDMVFATVSTDPILLEEAKRRGFYMKDTPANRMFNELFSNGGRLICSEEINPDYLKRAIAYLKALMRSYAPRHEEKEAVCAMLLDELVLQVVPGKK